jgi:dipicolinate synthase subunit A
MLWERGVFLLVNNISVTGGDLRQISVANNLYDLGYNVKVFACSDISSLNKNITVCDDAECCIQDADAVILPLPCSTDGSFISGTNIKIYDFFDKLHKECVVLGGKISEKVRSIGNVCGIELFDYFENETVEIKNAVPTAEGAIELAMGKTLTTIHGSECLVLGFGRISKILSRLLYYMGAKVTVAARKKSDLAWISALGYTAADINIPENLTRKYDVIFNTVPVCILNESILNQTDCNTLIIDLASKPGGVDFSAAQKLGINAYHALSLPGKVAPVTAGKILCDSIVEIIKERSKLSP